MKQTKEGNGGNTYSALLIRIFIFLILAASCLTSLADAQENRKGIVAGRLVDSQTGEPLIGASVMLEGTSMGAASDIDGNFIIKRVPVGSYNVVISSIGFTQTTVEAFEVSDSATARLELQIEPKLLTGKKIVVTAKAVQNTEASLLKHRQLSNSVSDAISAEAISRSGSGDAAAAVSRVIGASIVGGRYVYIRGLGDRYSNTRLNGSVLPSPDPDKQAVPMDLFPTALLDNIVVEKTFTPDKAGNFSGGSVNMGTKNLPEDLTMTFSTSTSHNSNATFNSGFLTQPSGSKDWLGYDDGTRAVPDALADPNVGIPSPAEGFTDKDKALEIDRLSKSLSSTMDPITRKAPLNQSYSFSAGNSYTVMGRPLGLMGSLSYNRSYSYYDDGIVGRWNLSQGSATTLTNDHLFNEVRGKDEVLWGGLGTLTYNISEQHRVRANYIYNRNAESEARFLSGPSPKDFPPEGDIYVYETRVLQYVERSMGSLQLGGDHLLKPFRVDWKFSASNSNQDEPDQRFFSNHYVVIFEGDSSYNAYQIARNLYPVPTHIYRYLDENNREGQIDASLPFKQWDGLNGKFKWGTSFLRKTRDVSERAFNIAMSRNIRFNGDPSEFLSYDNMGILYDKSDTLPDTIDGDGYSYQYGNTIIGASSPNNNYEGVQEVFGLYAMTELPITSWLNFVGGVRYETTDMKTKRKIDTTYPGEIASEDWLPSVNFILKLRENLNIRTAYGRTLARPTLREMSTFSAYEFQKGFRLTGNPDLKHTLIDNYDIRFEWFPEPGEIAAVSGFYKKFKDPIERSILYDNGEIQFRNVDRATVYGAEFELRKGLRSIYVPLRNFKIGGNLSLIHSEVKIFSVEHSLRKAYDPSAPDTRPMMGQSSFILNFDLSFESHRSGTYAAVLYNILGERLAEVSVGGTPDVYEKPRRLLDVTFAQKIWGGISLKLSGKNILDSKVRKVHEYKGNEYVWQEYSTGKTFSVGTSIQIF